MADYEITNPRTGVTLVVSGDRPPTQEEAGFLFKQDASSRQEMRAAPQPGVLQRVADMLPSEGVTGMIRGGLHGAANTVAGISKLFGATEDVPGSRLAAATEPRTPEERLGHFAEQTAEFVGPSAVAGGVTKGMNLAARAGAQGLASGAVGAAQTGDLKGGIVPGVVSGVAPLVGPAVRGLGKGAYRAGVALGNPTLKREFGISNMTNRGFAEEIPLNAPGASKAGPLISGSADDADALIASKVASQPPLPRGASNPGGAPGFVSLPDALADVQGLHTKAGKTALGVNEPARAQLERLSKSTASGHTWPIPLTEAQALKRGEQEIANNIYRSVERGGHVPATTQTRAQFGKSVANSTQRAIEQQVPEVATINKRTQDLIGLERLAERASEHNHVVPRLMSAIGMGALAGPAGIPASAATAGLGLLLGSPGGMSRLGLFLKSLGGGSAATTPAAEATRKSLIAALNAQITGNSR